MAVMSSRTTAPSLRSVRAGYDGPDVLHDLSLRFAPGEITAVTGPNGSGKSTLLELLAGGIRPRAGTVSRSGTIGLVVQRLAAADALPLTAEDVVRIGTWGAAGRRMTRGRRRLAVSEAIARVALSGLERRPFGELSGGQRQRALLAQGIVCRPDVLLLDEPTAGLDAASTERTRVILAEESARGAAVVCVTHDDDALGAGRVVHLEAGRVTADRSRSGRYAAEECRRSSRQ